MLSILASMKRTPEIILLLLGIIVTPIWAQRSPFSLQAAVDELHRQEFPLNAPPGQQPRFMTGGTFGPSPTDQDYWDEADTAAYASNAIKQRNRLNKQLAKYLERENYEADRGGLSLGPFGGYEFDEDSNKIIMPPQYQGDRKRSSSLFRERTGNMFDDLPASIFRERDPQMQQPSVVSDHSELTEQFLREIEKAQENDRQQDRYKDALRNIWEKYQQQENEINNDVMEEQKKRMRMPPYYMLMQKKRSYPVLPWLPYSADRKKRFPVAKRSAGSHAVNESPLKSFGKTDENVERELSELFGSAGTDEKKKRSIDSKQAKASVSYGPESTAVTMTNMRLEAANADKNETHEQPSSKTTSTVDTTADQHQHAGHSMKEHKHGKRSNHQGSHEAGSHEEEGGEEEDEDSDEEHESEEEEEGEHDHDHDHEHDHEHEDDEEAKRKKKKRNAANGVSKTSTAAEASKKKKRNAPVSLRRTMDDYRSLRSKKSIDWSKYFGIDRKKKAMAAAEASKDEEMKKRNAADETSNNSSLEEVEKKKKRKLDPTKLDNMNKKLQAIEDFIITETVKYTGAHEGIDNPEEIQRLKDRVLSRLATAYSLEKMRRALEKLRQSVENENHLTRNTIETDSDESSENTSLENIKKNYKAATSSSMPTTKSVTSTASADDGNTNEDEFKKKMKKRNGFMRYPEVANDLFDGYDGQQSNRYETLNDAYLGNKNYIQGNNQCPILEAMFERCRGVGLLSGDVNQNLLPICAVHQLCYLCGTTGLACDYQYLAESDDVCGPTNDKCLATARSGLMILRGTPGPQLGPKECVKNPCLYSAMREIGL